MEVSLSSTLLNNPVLCLHLFLDKSVSSSYIPLYKHPRLEVSPLKTATAPLSQTVPWLRDSPSALPSPCAAAQTCSWSAAAAEHPHTFIHQSQWEVLLCFFYGQSIITEITRHELLASSNPHCKCLCFRYLHKLLHGKPFFKHGTEQDCSRMGALEVILFLYLLNQHYGIMVRKEFLLQPQSNYWGGLTVPFLPFLHLLLSVSCFVFSLVFLITQHKLFINFARDYCKGSRKPKWGHLLFNTKSQAKPDFIISIPHPFLIKTVLGVFRREHSGLRAEKKCSLNKKYNDLNRNRKWPWTQNTFKLTVAVQIKRNFALLWMCEDFCQEVAMVTFQLSQTSSYYNYIS